MFAPVLRSARTAPPSSKGGGNGGNGGGERGSGDGAYACGHGGDRGRQGVVLDLREAGHDHLLNVLQVRSVERTVTGFSTPRQPSPCDRKSTIVMPTSKKQPLNY
jgi:hypothetical protein